MIALFESGNSRLHFAWWNGTTIKDPVNMSYPESELSLKSIIENLLGEIKPNKLAACSVSSRWRESLFKALNACVPGKLCVARTGFDIDIKIKYDEPETMGVDRVLAGYAAYRYVRNSCVVIDFGTAVTVDAINDDGTLMGGYIFPGMDMLSLSLSEKTGLPHVKVHEISERPGNSTETCILSGISSGFSGAVNNLVKSAASVIGYTNRILVTGGDAGKLLPYLPFEAVHKPHLVLEGLGYSVDKLPVYS